MRAREAVGVVNKIGHPEPSYSRRPPALGFARPPQGQLPPPLWVSKQDHVPTTSAVIVQPTRHIHNSSPPQRKCAGHSLLGRGKPCPSKRGLGT